MNARLIAFTISAAVLGFVAGHFSSSLTQPPSSAFASPTSALTMPGAPDLSAPARAAPSGSLEDTLACRSKLQQVQIERDACLARAPVDGGAP
ncbi:MAG TPA: hypothetical protein VGO62_15220 [Myxococcota bacterium]|jgi:hypothetical protein